MKNFNMFSFVFLLLSSFLGASEGTFSLKHTPSNEELSGYIVNNEVISSREVTPLHNNPSYISTINNTKYQSFLDSSNYEGLVEEILEDQPDLYQSRGMTKDQMKIYLLGSIHQIIESGLVSAK